MHGYVCVCVYIYIYKYVLSVICISIRVKSCSYLLAFSPGPHFVALRQLPYSGNRETWLATVLSLGPTFAASI